MENPRINDTIYRDLIQYWIPSYQRPVLQKCDLWILYLKIVNFHKKICVLRCDIILHCGSCCYQRYCICKYFSIKDKCTFYLRHPPYDDT